MSSREQHTLLTARDLKKAYGPQTLLDGVTFTLSAGDRVGLLGINGAGKSTLLRVTCALEPPDGGAVERRRGVTVRYLAQEPELPAGATALAVVEEGLVEWHAARTQHEAVSARLTAGDGNHDALVAEQARLAEAVERLGGWDRGHAAQAMLARLGIVDVTRIVDGMSGGERRRVALARLLVARPEVAVLDEPTNHLDADTIGWLEEHLSSWDAGAIFFVTHDRYVLDAVANRVLELERGRLREFDGNYSDYLAQKAELLAQTEREEANRQNFLRREREWLSRGPQARTTKQKARIQRAEAVIAEDAKAPKAGPDLKLEGAATGRLGGTILELRGVGATVGGEGGREGAAARRLFKDLTLHLVAGQRVGIVGPNGTGKTTFLRLVAGEQEPAEGQVVRGARTKLAYFDQARAELRDTWSIFDDVADREGAESSGGGVVEVGGRTIPLRTYLEQFLFDASKQRQKVGSLSGGERARVALAKLLRGGANLLLLDEPTNDLDVATLGALEEMLATWPGCALVVSHDRAFLDGVATSILAFEDGKVTLYPGNYDTYRRLKAEAAQSATAGPAAGRGPGAKTSAPPPTPAAAKGDGAPPGAKPLTYAERLELEGIFERVGEAEARVTELEARLADPAFYGEGAESAAKAKAVQGDLAAAQEALTKVTARWEELEARAAATSSGRR